MNTKIYKTAVALGLSVLGASAFAQQYPNKPVRMIVPYGTGGNADTVSRLLAPFMADILGQQIVIDNRGGAAGIPGMVAVSQAAPDGYTALFAASNLAANPILYKTLPYDAEKDFAPVTLVAVSPPILVVPTSLGINSVKDLIALAKSKPGQVNYGSAGNGSGSHLTAEMFASVAGIKIVHVPYKSSGALLADVVSGRLEFTFGTIPSSVQLIQGGKLKALGVSSAKRSSAVPDVPTIAETALPGFDVNTWLGVLVPRATPVSVINTLNASVVKSLDNATVKERLKALGSDSIGSTPQQLGAYLKNEMDGWKKLAQTVKFEVAD